MDLVTPTLPPLPPSLPAEYLRTRNVQKEADETKFELLNKEIDALNNPLLEPLLPAEDDDTIRNSERDISSAAFRETNAELGVKEGESYENLARAQALVWFTKLEERFEERSTKLRADALSYSLQHVIGRTNPTRFNEYLQARARLRYHYHSVRQVMRMKKAYVEKKEKEEEVIESRRALSYGEKVMKWQAMVMSRRKRHASYLASVKARRASKGAQKRTGAEQRTGSDQRVGTDDSGP
ncbi:hypothetical protein PV08_09658 [Exophiala spinifera]|uniref:Uncharacterized protein n=1 Tax=Exophiala spinifera TaxID=91928 RepID=A0A0D1YBS5_9EURO|nr:uncharacterized protein PV08_09658 [Exophiala spinifera]KIW12381.1 hypothetical protein PV08_09658 [Exophiala spinifera]